jgi:hypothetical protein
VKYQLFVDHLKMHPLAQQLSALRRRLVLRQRATAACWTAATILAAAAALGFVDYVVRISDPGLRVMSTLALTAAATWAVYRWWYRPMWHQLRPLAVARQVEAHFPQLHDSLASAVEFLVQSEEDLTAGSAQLRRLVVAEAQSAIERLPLDEVVDRRPLRRAARWLAVPAAAILFCLAWDASAVGTALVRLVSPLGSAEWPRSHHLAFRQVPSRLAVGETFEVELVDTAGPLPDDVRIEYRIAGTSGSQSSSETMVRAGDVLVARRENVRQSFAFRAVGGDDHTMRWHLVEVVEPPRLEEFSVVAHPPSYAGLPAASAEGHLEVLAGTGLEVQGTASEPLAAASILMDGAPPVAATIGAASEGRERHAFRVDTGQWTADKSGPYRVELTNAKGVSGVAGQWNLRVQPDPPPSVSWLRPAEDLYVTATAIVPIAAVVQDNLAIQHVELLNNRSGDSGSSATNETPNASTGSRIELYRRADVPSALNGTASTAQGETRNVEYQWNVASLTLPVGTELDCHIDATDYRPGTGRTPAPRRITIISSDELHARLADRQAQIVRQLERALATQRATREDVRRYQIQHVDSSAPAKIDRVALQSAELNQTRTGELLVDKAAGVTGLARSLFDEVEINRLSAPDLRTAMDGLLAELDRLSAGPLSVAESELVAARKAGEAGASNESNSADVQQIADSLVKAGIAQDEVIASLERLIGALSGRTDIRRLAQQLAELLRDQIAHEQTVRQEIGVETLPLQQSDLSRGQRAKLNSAAEAQSAIATRYENIVRAIDRLGQETIAEDPATAEIAAGAAELARSLAIATDMQEVSQDLRQNRVGQALERETQVAADLQQILEALRGGGVPGPQQLAEQLRKAEQRLSQLRERLAALRQQVEQAEQQTTNEASSEQRRQLATTQQTLKRETEQLADQLQKLQAASASESTQRAANRLNQSPAKSNDQNGNQPRPAESSDVQKAEQDLQQAAEQLAQQRQQAENDLALKFVRRFQAELGSMVERQKNVIAGTIRLDTGRKSTEQLGEKTAQEITKLASEERELAKLAGEHAELLSGLGAVRMGLEEAGRRLSAAAGQLDENVTGTAAQQAERYALARLEAMLDAFAQTASEASQNPPAGNNAGPSGQPPQRRPTFELLEVKMLRMLQVDLNERTRAIEDQLAALSQPLPNDDRTRLTREAQHLQAEQRRLAELVQEMLARDNGDVGSR